MRMLNKCNLTTDVTKINLIFQVIRYRQTIFKYIGICCVWFTGRPHQTLWQVTNWWTERAQVSWTSLARALSVCRHSATSAPTRCPRSLASAATSRVILLAAPPWTAYRQDGEIPVVLNAGAVSLNISLIQSHIWFSICRPATATASPE